MFDDLLPLSAEAPRCNDFARSIGLRPPGSGLFLDRVVVVSLPLPWPKPALKHPELEAAARHIAASSTASRLFAAEPFSDTIQIEVYERSGAASSMHCWTLENTDAIEPLASAIAQAELTALDTVTASGAVRAQVAPDTPTFLVCTQGSHDQCCGTSGVALADEISQHRPGYNVRRVSHTGGHRFSPTLIAFPEGRMWAYCDLDLVDRIAQGSTTAADYSSHARGWWGARVGPAQVAECAVRAELAAQAFVVPEIAAIESPAGTSRFRVATGDHVFDVDVVVGRQVPSITCEAPGGLPAKPGREFTWTIDRAEADA